MNMFTTAALAAAFACGASAASAASINFDDGDLASGVYTQGAYVYQGVSGENVATPSSCGSACALLQNDSSSKTYVLSRLDGLAFTLESFYFNGLGKDEPALQAATSLVGGTLAGTIYTASENNNSNTMSFTGALGQFMNVTAVFFQTTGDGSARIDDIEVSSAIVSEVPLPASAVLLLAGLGGLAAMRRRKS